MILNSYSDNEIKFNMESLNKRSAPKEKEQAMKTLGLMKQTIHEVHLQVAGYQGKDLNMVIDMLSDAAVTYACAMSDNGETAESNALLREAGLYGLCDPE